jgi:DNA polymerase
MNTCNPLLNQYHEHQQAAYNHKQWETCQRCPLYLNRWKAVHYRFCEYHRKFPCDLLVVGEAPGRTEDTFGVPFIGAAGERLDIILGLVTMLRTLTWCITNTVACIPKDAEGDTRPPEPIEMEACFPRLEILRDLCHPKLYVAVGQVASSFLLQKGWQPVVEIQHPAWILRQPREHWTVLIHQQAGKILSAWEENKLTSHQEKPHHG